MRGASRVRDNLLIRLSDSSINISNLLAYHIRKGKWAEGKGGQPV